MPDFKKGWSILGKSDIPYRSISHRDAGYLSICRSSIPWRWTNKKTNVFDLLLALRICHVDSSTTHAGIYFLQKHSCWTHKAFRIQIDNISSHSHKMLWQLGSTLQSSQHVFSAKPTELTRKTSNCHGKLRISRQIVMVPQPPDSQEVNLGKGTVFMFCYFEVFLVAPWVKSDDMVFFMPKKIKEI